MRAKDRVGFTLIELMVVVVIIGVLAAIVVPQYLAYADKARAKATAGQINIIQGALGMYKLDSGAYPSSSEGLQGLVQKPASYKGAWPKDGYMPSVPKDGWANDFLYVCPGSAGKSFDIISYGAVGKEGGEDVDADIRN